VTEPLIAVFIDYENIALGVHDMDAKQSVELGLVLNRLLEKGRIVYKRAYCDWSRFRKATLGLHKHGVIMVDIPQTGVSGKNSADIHVVVDAMDLCYSKAHINTFALLSGDSDFSPLVYKLKECDKRVVGCGVKSSTSGLLVKSCDEFIYYDDLVRRASAKPAKRKPSDEKGDDKQLEGIDQVLEIVKALADDYENVWGSMVKQTLSRVNPAFNHAYHGFKSFDALLREMEKRGLIELEMDKTRGNYMVRLKES
jgi:uncharacterized LabA/DUF88 family protein